MGVLPRCVKEPRQVRNTARAAEMSVTKHLLALFNGNSRKTRSIDLKMSLDRCYKFSEAPFNNPCLSGEPGELAAAVTSWEHTHTHVCDMDGVFTKRPRLKVATILSSIRNRQVHRCDRIHPWHLIHSVFLVLHIMFLHFVRRALA